jgi:hypothetical protein
LLSSKCGDGKYFFNFRQEIFKMSKPKGRGIYIYFRASGPEAEALDRIARRKGITTAAVMRDLIRIEAERLGFPPVGLIPAVESIPAKGKSK